MGRALELKHLRSVVAAADCGSLRQAAELLRSQQSCLSRRINEIEHHLGIAIFERFSGGVRPTQAGRSVLRLARTILEEFDTLIATAEQFGTVNRSAQRRILHVAFGWQSSSVLAGFQARSSWRRLNDHEHARQRHFTTALSIS
ncbi:LysR family transcriptional regulator [Bradyrhizobium sp. CCBAU 11386]|uniref:LysR family transcriptional regulator n=1 Tax=Bradyrhizobium sp. CCBAU 11386 TaxID=1630837 RepID=UPI002FE3AC18